MWFRFLLALPISFVFIYVPGYLIGRACSRDRFVALGMAPLLTTVAYEILCIAYGKMGIFTKWYLVFMPACFVGALLMVMSLRFADSDDGRHAAVDKTTPRMSLKEELLVYLPYLVVGLGVCLVYFIKPLDGPESFTCRTDNTEHLNLIWRYVQTGNWSMLNGSLHADPTRAAIAGASYYPAGWHIFPSIIAQAFGASAPFGANAINAVLIGITIPTSSYLLTRSVLADKPLALRLGAVFPLAFGVFPWHIIIPEAKESFFFGLTLAPACIAMFVIACEGALDGRLNPKNVLLAALALLACAIAHPIAVFSTGVLLVPYLMYFIWRASTKGARDRKSVLRGLLCCAAFGAFVVGVWYLCYHVPFIYVMTLWMHWSYTSRKEALLRIVFMGFKDVPPQPLLALFVWSGIIYSLYRKRYLWMSCSFGLFSMMYFIDATTDHIIKRWLTGFWYTDFNRLAASACIIAVPLAALGLYAWVRVAQHLFESISANDRDAKRFAAVTGPVLCAFVALAVIYYPSYQMPHAPHKTKTAFGYTASQAKKFNSFKNNVMDEEEVAFLDEVKDVVGDDLVINCPVDGSAFAYVTNDINVYYRRYNITYMTDDAKTLITRLNNLSTDAEVQGIIDELDAKYVLLLDEGFAPESSVYWDKYNDKQWSGFARITDQAEGLDLVLSEGDMRLYRIVDEAA